MDLQSHVRVYNEALGVKGAKGKLLQIHASGYYEIASNLYLCSASGFSSAAIAIPSSGAWEAAIGDLNADGMPELVFANRRNGSGQTNADSTIYWNSGTIYSTANRTGLSTMGAAGVSIAAR